jgi:hypothetical protein
VLSILGLPAINLALRRFRLLDSFRVDQHQIRSIYPIVDALCRAPARQCRKIETDCLCPEFVPAAIPKLPVGRAAIRKNREPRLNDRRRRCELDSFRDAAEFLLRDSVVRRRVLPDARNCHYAVRLGKVSLSRVCHPHPRRCRYWFGTGIFSA